MREWSNVWDFFKVQINVGEGVTTINWSQASVMKVSLLFSQEPHHRGHECSYHASETQHQLHRLQQTGPKLFEEQHIAALTPGSQRTPQGKDSQKVFSLLSLTTNRLRLITYPLNRSTCRLPCGQLQNRSFDFVQFYITKHKSIVSCAGHDTMKLV